MNLHAHETIDPALIVAELNTPEKIASVLEEADDKTRAFKLKATGIKGIANEIKDFLGRSEYNAIKLHEVAVYPDRLAGADDKWIDAGGIIRNYEQDTLVRGHTIIRANLHFRD